MRRGCRPQAKLRRTPVKPRVSRRARVLVFTGVFLSILIRTSTRLGSSSEMARCVTSPTLRPLKSTAAPRDRPATEPEKTSSYVLYCAVWLGPENQKTKLKAATTTAIVKAPIRAKLARVSMNRPYFPRPCLRLARLSSDCRARRENRLAAKDGPKRALCPSCRPR